MRHLRLALILPAALALGACAQLGMDGSGSAAAPEPAPVTPGRVTSSNPSAAPAAQAVAGTEAAAAAARDAAGAGPVAASGALGTTTASLGDATQGGLWLKTPLVRAPRSGRIVDMARGRSTDVELLPLSGAVTGGSQISHGAMHALGLDLTELPELQVFAA